MRRELFAVSLLLAPTVAFAQTSPFTKDEIRGASMSPEYFTLDMATVKLEKVGPADLPVPSPNPLPPGEGVPGNPIADIGTIINIGQKIWQIIVANKPVVDIKTSFAAAVPKGITSADQLSGWKPPEGTVYALKAKNVYGTEVINLRYMVLRTAGGAYDGKGKYLTAVTVQPLNVDVLWGYRFTLSASAPSTTNAGTATDPVAGMMLVLDWKIETPIKESRGSGVYYVQGDGVFKDVSAPFRQRLELKGPSF